MTADIIPFPRPRRRMPGEPSEAALRYFDEIVSRRRQYELPLYQPSAIALAALERVLRRSAKGPYSAGD